MKSNSFPLPNATAPTTPRITVPQILARKGSGVPLCALTAYDHWMAKLLDGSGVDLILVGDSLGSVMQGLENTLAVTLDQMVYHTRCVASAVTRALVVADLPFLSYQPSIERAIESAGRLLKEGQAAAVKLEGGVAMADTIQRLSELDIPVMGHVGLTPQSFHRMGGHKLQGRTHDSTTTAEAAQDKRKHARIGTWERVLEDALAVAEAGAFALVIEGVPAELGAEITRRVALPTIGIGAGPDCDGQILVAHDMLGLLSQPAPRFVKQYAQLAEAITQAARCYVEEVQRGAFPERTA